jgi:hypothetical protein
LDATFNVLIAFARSSPMSGRGGGNRVAEVVGSSLFNVTSESVFVTVTRGVSDAPGVEVVHLEEDA